MEQKIKSVPRLAVWLLLLALPAFTIAQGSHSQEQPSLKNSVPARVTVTLFPDRIW